MSKISEGRGLGRVAVAGLATCGFAKCGENVVLFGPIGTGKTYLSRALAKAACAKRIRTCYIRQPDLEDLWCESRDRPGGERKPLRKYGAFGPLAIDELPLELFRGCCWSFSSCATGGYRPSYVHSSERRTGTRGLGGGVHADAIMDRIVHNAVWLEMGDMNIWQAMAGKGR